MFFLWGVGASREDVIGLCCIDVRQKIINGIRSRHSAVLFIESVFFRKAMMEFGPEDDGDYGIPVCHEQAEAC